MAEQHGTNDLRERPTSELLKQLSDQTTTLVRQEIELAKLEVREKGKKAGVGAGMFGGAGVFGLYAVGALTATIILALATFLPGWVAALIVTVIYGAIAGVIAKPFSPATLSDEVDRLLEAQARAKATDLPEVPRSA